MQNNSTETWGGSSLHPDCSTARTEAHWRPTGKAVWTTNKGTVEEWHLRAISGEIIGVEWRPTVQYEPRGAKPLLDYAGLDWTKSTFDFDFDFCRACADLQFARRLNDNPRTAPRRGDEKQMKIEVTDL